MAFNKSRAQVLLVEAAALVVSCVVMFLVLWFRTLPRAGQAKTFLRDVATLKVGKSTFAEVKAFAARHAGQPEPGRGACTYQACSFQFLYENKPLSSTYLKLPFDLISGVELRTGVPYAALLGALDVRDGVLAERYIHYVRYSKRPFAYNVREIVSAESDRTEAPAKRLLVGFSRMNVDSAGVPSAISIVLSPATGPDQRRRAYAVDVSCLSRIFGCAGPSAIFPPSIPYRSDPYQTNAANW